MISNLATCPETPGGATLSRPVSWLCTEDASVFDLSLLRWQPGNACEAAVAIQGGDKRATCGIVVTAIYLLGMIEWKDRTIWRMGIDSAAVLVCYLGSLGVLYTLR